MKTYKKTTFLVSVAFIISISGLSYAEEFDKSSVEQEKKIKELEAQIKELKTTVVEQRKEIKRLRLLCRKAGVNPNGSVLEEDKQKDLKYEVLNEDVYDAPIKTQIELNILISGNVTEDGLRTLLNQLYSSLKKRDGFKYHKNPTNIYIYAFTSKERFESGMGQWIAMMAKNYDDIKPEISINERQIAHLGDKPEERFSLSEVQRIQIWEEYVKTEDRSMEEAEKRYPLTYPLTQGLSESEISKRIKKNAELMHRLEKRYKNELAKKYGLTPKQLEEIANEGIEKSWPFPK